MPPWLRAMPLLFAIMVLASGCEGKAPDDDGRPQGDGDAAAGPDSDGDGDSDTDTDADTDADGDTDAISPLLPEPTGPCPEFVSGDLIFSPSGIEIQRSAHVWISDQAETKDGPLLLYWHATGSGPTEAVYGLGSNVIAEVKAQGGLVVAPVPDPAAGTYEWFLVSGLQEDDLLLMDEIVACAIEKVGVDTRRIHTLGMSAGGLNTAQASFRRSNYIASAVTYSGGISYLAPAIQNEENRFAAMIFHGGDDDVYVLDFQDTSEAFLRMLQENGHFAFVCNHGRGHTIPADATGSVWRFFQDHPFGTDPSPYEGGLPEGFASYCSL